MEIYLLGSIIACVVTLLMISIVIVYEENTKLSSIGILLLNAISAVMSWLWILFVIIYFTLEYIKGKR